MIPSAEASKTVDTSIDGLLGGLGSRPARRG